MRKILVLGLICCSFQVLAQTFSTTGNAIFDPCLDVFIPRGVNYSLADDWNFPANLNNGKERSSEIVQANPNTVRIQWYVNYGNASRPALTLVGLDSVITRFARANIVSMLEIHDFTHIHTDTNAFNNQIINWWTSSDVLDLIDKHKSHILVNIANEYGPALYPAPNYTLNPNYASEIATWVVHYKSCITYLRNAGISVPLIIDAPNYGMDHQTVINNATIFKNHDPLNSIIMSCHGYWDSDVVGMQSIINQLAILDVPVILGEIGNVDFACNPIQMNALLTAATANDIGWLAWTWNRDECAVRNMTANVTNPTSTTDGTFASLSAYGSTIVNNPTFGLLATALKPDPGCLLHVLEINKNFDFSIFPNPSNDMVRISFDANLKSIQLTIVNQIGEIVETIIPKSNEINLNVSKWESGIYYLKMASAKQYQIKKLAVLND